MWANARQDSSNQGSPGSRETTENGSSLGPAASIPAKRKIGDGNPLPYQANGNPNTYRLGRQDWQERSLKPSPTANAFEQHQPHPPIKPFNAFAPVRVTKSYFPEPYLESEKPPHGDIVFHKTPFGVKGIRLHSSEKTELRPDNDSIISDSPEPSISGVKAPVARSRQESLAMPQRLQSASPKPHGQMARSSGLKSQSQTQSQQTLFLGLPFSTIPNPPSHPQTESQAQLQSQLSIEPQRSFSAQMPFQTPRPPLSEPRAQSLPKTEQPSNPSFSGASSKPEQHALGVTQTASSTDTLAIPTKPVSSNSGPKPNLLPVPDELELKPLKYKVFKEHVQKVNREVEQHHSQCAASWIARANVGATSAQVSLYTGKARMDKVSPFASMNKIPYHHVSRSKLAPGEQMLAYYVPSEMSVKADDTTAVYRTKSYSTPAYTIPPYTHYASSKRNILVEGVRQRTFLPYLGETDENLDEDYKALQFKILSNQDKNRDLMDGEEFGSVWLPYVHSLLADLGTNVHAVLHILLDESRQGPPESLPIELNTMFHGRADWISHGFYEEEDDVEATKGDGEEKPRQPQKQWQNALSNLPVVDDRSLAAAVMVCSVFDEVAGFSIWHIVRQTTEAFEAVSSAKRPTSKERSEPERAALHAYIDQACLVCKTHQCFGHGEYSDGEEEKDVRIAMTSGLDALKLSGNVESQKKRGETFGSGELKILLGRDPTGSVEGGLWANFSDESPGLKDDEFCSTNCFWDKRNRRTENMKKRWSRAEVELLQAVGPSNVCQRRGACAIARMGILNRTCVDIFARLVRMVPPKALDRASRADTSDSSVKNKPWNWWLQKSDTWKHQQRNPFRPCNHSGSCKENPDCSCTKQGISCEKSCNCSINCSRRFRGCQCAAKGKPCYQSETCDCFKLNRECDPDVCHTCGAHEILDPVNRYDENIAKGRCCNVSIQRALPKRTLLGQSKLLAAGGIVGWGLFMGEPVKKGDYVGEYVGEIVTPDEAEQRGIIYNAMNMSYLFDLNKKQVLDSTPIGNKLRYINHQGDEFANCRAQVMFCAGVQRIGMFTTKNIDIGEELLFNYGAAFASKIDLVTMHRDGTITVEKANKAAWDPRSSPMDEDDDAAYHKKGRGPRRIIAASENGDGQEDDEGDDDEAEVEAEDDDDMEIEEEDDDDDVDEGPRHKSKSKRKAGKTTGGRVAKQTISGSDRMRKAWITRYANLGLSAQAQRQKKKYNEMRRRDGPGASA